MTSTTIVTRTWERVRVPLLDHGFIELIEPWGSDEGIIEAARMSTDKGFQGWGPMWRRKRCGHVSTWQGRICPDCGDDDGTMMPVAGDEKLLAYLYRNKHSTPFEMAGFIIEVQAPIFVFREWHRHRTQSYNELSARYTPIPNLNYVPTVERLMMSAGASKQSGAITGAEELTPESAEIFRQILMSDYQDAEDSYQAALKRGVPKELARLIIPVGRYSRMRASANLRNWLAFLTLREAENAQWEIRQYAHQVAQFVKKNFPRTFELYAGDV